MKKSIFALSGLIAVCVATSVLAAPQQQESGMAIVQAIEKRSHQEQQQKRNQAVLNQAAAKERVKFMSSIINTSNNTAKQQLVTNTPAPRKPLTPVASAPAAAATAAGKTVQFLESQISALNKENNTFKQQTDQRIDTLNQEHSILQNKLSQLGQVLSMLNQEVTQLNQQIQSAQKQLVGTETPAQMQHDSHNAFIKNFAAKAGDPGVVQYVLYGIMLLLIIIILMLIPRRRGYKMETVSTGVMPPEASNESKEGDYDFMGSDEAMPAKLDLARAYLAMEDYKSARKILQQVTKSGDDAQRADAKAMLDKIPKGE